MEIIKEEELFKFDDEESKHDDEFIKQKLFTRYNVAGLCMSLNSKLSAGQLSYLIDLHKNTGTDL